ncbi:PilN domain-containing protein [Lysobacter sp. A289]
MARINLLPWRAERRKQRQKDAMLMLALSALAAVVLSFLIVGYHNAQIDGQTERNSFLKARIAEVDKKITEIDELDRQKSKLLARKDVIEKLQANRSQMVHLFDSLVRTIPDGVILTAIKQDDETLSLEGRSQSSARVSTYMRNLEGSSWMTQPELSIIEAKGFEKGLPYEFKLQVKMANPNAPTDEDGDGVPDSAVEDVAVEDAAAAMPEAAAASPDAGTAPATGAADDAVGSEAESAVAGDADTTVVDTAPADIPTADDAAADPAAGDAAVAPAPGAAS